MKLLKTPMAPRAFTRLVPIGIVVAAGALASSASATPDQALPWCTSGVYASNGDCCVDSDCRDHYPYPGNVDGDQNAASSNPGGIEPPQTVIDSGIPDPVDTATDPDGSGPPVGIAEALSSEGVDMSKVTVLDEYSAVIAAGAATYTDCPAHYTCMWRHAGYQGRAYFATAGVDGYVWRNLRDFGLSDEISSWRNRRGWVSVLARDTDGLGPELCMARYSHNPRMYYFNDQASSFKLTLAKFCGS